MAEKMAFCLLLWSARGGLVARGQPVFSANAVSGDCDNPECYRCTLMQQEMAQHPQGHVNWVCPACLRDAIRVAKDKGVQAYLTGHYTEGQCQFVGCTRPARTEFDSETESYIEKPRGYSRYLQLVIGDINT